MSYKQHMFICTNGNPDDPTKCAAKGALHLHAEVKEGARQTYNPQDVRINRSGCLGYCEKGITAVLYPQGRWFFRLQQNSAEELLCALEEAMGRPPA